MNLISIDHDHILKAPSTFVLEPGSFRRIKYDHKVGHPHIANLELEVSALDQAVDELHNCHIHKIAIPLSEGEAMTHCIERKCHLC